MNFHSIEKQMKLRMEINDARYRFKVWIVCQVIPHLSGKCFHEHTSFEFFFQRSHENSSHSDTNGMWPTVVQTMLHYTLHVDCRALELWQWKDSKWLRKSDWFVYFLRWFIFRTSVSIGVIITKSLTVVITTHRFKKLKPETIDKLWFFFYIYSVQLRDAEKFSSLNVIQSNHLSFESIFFSNSWSNNVSHITRTNVFNA